MKRIPLDLSPVKPGSASGMGIIPGTLHRTVARGIGLASGMGARTRTGRRLACFSIVTRAFLPVSGSRRLASGVDSGMGLPAGQAGILPMSGFFRAPAILAALVLLWSGALFLPVGLSAGVPAQAGGPLNEELTVSRDSGAASFTLSWWGSGGRAYFIQFSPDLISGWQYVPLIEQGFDETIAWSFYLAGGSGRAFFRLRFTDAPAPDPYLSVFGGDGIPSGWKLENELDPFANYTGLSPEGGALTYWELWQFSLAGGSDPAKTNAAGLIVYTP